MPVLQRHQIAACIALTDMDGFESHSGTEQSRIGMTEVVDEKRICGYGIVAGAGRVFMSNGERSPDIINTPSI